MDIPISALPGSVLALWYVAGAGFFVVFWRSWWRDLARPVTRLFIVGAGYWVVYAGILSATNEVAASAWYHWFLPMGFLIQIAAIEVEMVLISVRIPSWYRLVWAAGLVALVMAAVLPWHPRMGQIPAGYWVSLVHPSWLMRILKTVLYGGGALVIVGIYAVKAWHQPRRRYRWLAAFGAFNGLLYANDAVWALHHHTVYPTLWVSGVLILAALFWEGRSQVVMAEHQMTRDDITGVLTRTAGLRFGRQMLSGSSLAVYYIDLDGFKVINDTFGHALGDEVLAILGPTLQAACRPKDRVVRMGGDEFLVLAPGVAESDAHLMQERIREAISKTVLTVPGDPRTVTVRGSVGMAWSPIGARLEEVIGEADGTMYEDKLAHREEHG